MNHHHFTAQLLRRLGEVIAAASSQAMAANTDAARVSRELEPLEQIGLQMQSMARVLSGRGQHAPERIDLGLATLQLRAEWAGELQRRGATLDGAIEPLEVRMCAGVLKQVLDLALGHVLALGVRIQLSLHHAGDPPLPTLKFTVRLPGGELFGVSPEALDELHWSLLVILTDAEGLRLERHVEGHQVVLSLGLLPSL